MSIPRKGIVIASVPGVLMLVLYYSLAAHMYRSLGGWPGGIGEAGFPRGLLIHAELATGCWVVLVMSMILVPIVFGVCLCRERWHGHTALVAAYFVSVALSLLLTWTAAPAGFLRWWHD